MRNKRILVSQDDTALALIEQAYQAEKSSVIDKVHAFRIAFDKLGIGELDTDKYLSILRGGIEPYLEESLNAVMKQLQDAKMSVPALVESAIAKQQQLNTDASYKLGLLLEHRNRKPPFQGIQVQLENVELVSGSLPQINDDIDIEAVKDRIARKYIDSELGFELHEKAVELQDVLNSINCLLRSKGEPNITDLREFSEFVEYPYTSNYHERMNCNLEVNLAGIYSRAKALRDKAL